MLPLSSQRISNTACVKRWAPLKFELHGGDCSPGSDAKLLFLQPNDVSLISFVYEKQQIFAGERLETRSS